MELNEAIQKSIQILNEERTRPTVSYQPSPGETITQSFAALARLQAVFEERKKRPRHVHESPDEFRLRSVNYELLLALYSQVPINERADFVTFLLSRMPDGASSNSDFPLVAEFCVRAGYKRELIRAVGKSRFSGALLRLLMQLEETVALNFNLFSDEELEQLATTLKDMRARAHLKTYQFIRARSGGERVRNPHYDSTVALMAKEIVAVCDGIVEECEQARYWYLKGALQQNANLEINLDKGKVEGYLKTLGFSGPLLEALNAAEQDFRESATPFELKNCLGHLRSFLEGLHGQACKPVAAKAGIPPPKKWGETTNMLRDNTIISRQEESLATSLYTLISDEGVHPLMAGREYARLLRNMVIEYGLMFLTKLERAGINLR